MENWAIWLQTFLESDLSLRVLEAVLKVAVGLLLARLAAAAFVRFFVKDGDVHQKVVVKRFSFYAVFGLFAASALVGLGFDLSVLLGAAGILTVALGFASQTSASNIISGLFLLGERPFSIGDVIRINNITGEVLSIDLLSAKLRTFDNLFVRVPNETLIKSEIQNLTRFPMRRVDIPIGVAYKEDMNKVRKLLMEVAHENPICLEHPEPLFIFQGYGDSALNFQFSVWAVRENFLALRTSIMVEIKEAFDAHGIEIPFPHRSLYTGSVTEPFPIRIVPGENTTLPPQA